ncbi:hypothetical protein HK096_004389 [Nowakowskiella sp. JEL0078]|nr:hypothetical protein HK096_004389 [Nowakowskiella sp. JEL0078]
MVVPTLLGLKGNLEMTLSSRLATLANSGTLDNPKYRVAGFASFWSILLSGVLTNKWDNAANTSLLCGSAIISACFASAFLGLSMCLIVVICRLIKVDPDNMTTPIAASMGDLITLLTLAGVSSIIFPYMDSPLALILVVFTLCTLPIWALLVLNNEHVKHELNSAWPFPLMMAVFISSFAGLGLEKFMEKFSGLAALIPVHNGICGNIACIYASRLSTELHKIRSSIPSNLELGKLPRKVSRSQSREKLKGNRKSTTEEFMLLFIGISAQSVFLLIVKFLGIGGIKITILFSIGYLLSSIAVVKNEVKEMPIKTDQSTRLKYLYSRQGDLQVQLTSED